MRLYLTLDHVLVEARPVTDAERRRVAAMAQADREEFQANPITPDPLPSGEIDDWDKAIAAIKRTPERLADIRKSNAKKHAKFLLRRRQGRKGAAGVSS
jgi:hypothetical protein